MKAWEVEEGIPAAVDVDLNGAGSDRDRDNKFMCLALSAVGPPRFNPKLSDYLQDLLGQDFHAVN